MTRYFLLLRSFEPFYPLTDFLLFFTSVSNNIITSCSAVQLWPWTDFYSFCHFWLVFIYLKRVEKVNFGKKDFYNSGHFYPYYTKYYSTPLWQAKKLHFQNLKNGDNFIPCMCTKSNNFWIDGWVVMVPGGHTSIIMVVFDILFPWQVVKNFFPKVKKKSGENLIPFISTKYYNHWRWLGGYDCRRTYFYNFGHLWLFLSHWLLGK